MRLAAHTIAHEVDAMRDVIEGINTLYGDDMRLVVCEIIVCQDSRFYGLEIRAFFEFDIHHAAMDARSQGDGHREGILHAGDGFRRYRMTHRPTRTEIGVGQSLGRKGLEDGTDHRIASRIPARGDDADGLIGHTYGIQCFAQVPYLPVNIETIDGAYPACSKDRRELLYLARRCANQYCVCVDAV